jgi:hypothetical protein
VETTLAYCDLTTIMPGNVLKYKPQDAGNLPLNISMHANINRTACIRYLCMKITVFSCHRCLIQTSVEKINGILI